MNFNENFIKAKEKMFCKNPDYNFALNELKNINKEKETICIIHMKAERTGVGRSCKEVERND